MDLFHEFPPVFPLVFVQWLLLLKIHLVTCASENVFLNWDILIVGRAKNDHEKFRIKSQQKLSKYSKCVHLTLQANWSVFEAKQRSYVDMEQINLCQLIFLNTCLLE